MLRRARRRRALSMTSLIDVIFLLLLFFMLSSTFTRFAEVELAAAGSGAGTPSEVPPIFLQLTPDAVTVNGSPQSLSSLALPEGPRTVLVSLKPGVTAQRLTDLLVTLRRHQGLSINVLSAG